jgi:hypothetical protein
MPFSSSSPAPSTDVPSVPSTPKRASAADEVNSLVLDARVRGVPARQANTGRAAPTSYT